MKKIISALLIATMLCSMVVMSVSVSADSGSFVDNFDDAEFTNSWMPGHDNLYVENGYLIGTSGARAWQGAGEGDAKDGPGYTPALFEAQWTISAVLDEGQDAGAQRDFGYAYCTYDETGAQRNIANFFYNWGEGKFYLGNGLLNPTGDDAQLMPAVEKAIVADGETFTLGMRVDLDRIRCYYNDEVIFDYKAEGKSIGLDKSLIFSWNTGNKITADKFQVAEPGTLYADPKPVYFVDDFTDPAFTAVWMPGSAADGGLNFNVEDGYLVGTGPCLQAADYPAGYTPETFDLQWTMSSTDVDEDAANARNTGFTYLTYNADGSIMNQINFLYDWVGGKFYLKNGLTAGPDGEDVMDPVEKAIVADGETYHIGMRVVEGKLVCYYNDEAIFTYEAADKGLGEAAALIFGWTNGSTLKFDKLEVAEANSITMGGAQQGGEENPPADDPDQTPPTGDVAFVVVAAMVIALGSAIIVKKVSVR